MRAEKLEQGNVREAELRRMFRAALRERLSGAGTLSDKELRAARAQALRAVLDDVLRELRRAQEKYGRPERARGPARDLESVGAAYQLLRELEVRWDGQRLHLRRRRLADSSRFYAPRYVVEFTVEATLAPLLERARRAVATLSPGGRAEEMLQPYLAVRVLDLCAGCGHFLLGALERIVGALAADSRIASQFGEATDESATHLRRMVAQRCLFGQERDEQAAWLARAVLALAAGDWSLAEKLRENIVAADALAHEPPREWAAGGQFAAIVGHIPRELPVEDEELRRRLRAAREQGLVAGAHEAWQLFAHRALDVLPVGGRLGLVVAASWLTRGGGEALRGRLLGEGFLEKLAVLRNWPVFARVGGDWVVFVFEKGAQPGETEVREPATGRPGRRGIMAMLAGAPGQWRMRQMAPAKALAPRRYGPPRPPPAPADAVPLGEVFCVAQGVVAAPERVTERLAAQLARKLRLGADKLLKRLGVAVGQGVFVLTPEERQALDLPEEEQRALVPYLGPEDIARWQANSANVKYLIYASAEIGFNPQRFPALCAHLERFRELIEFRRRASRAARPWYCLLWPRRRELFSPPRVLVRALARQPTCCVAEGEVFVGHGVNVIVPPDDEAASAIAALLNSAWAERWFFARGERRRGRVRIGTACLRAFPLPRAAARWLQQAPSEREPCGALAELVRLAHRLAQARGHEARQLEEDLNAAVFELYGASWPK